MSSERDRSLQDTMSSRVGGMIARRRRMFERISSFCKVCDRSFKSPRGKRQHFRIAGHTNADYSIFNSKGQT